MVLVLARKVVEDDEIRLSKPVKSVMRAVYIKATDGTKRALQVFLYNFVDVHTMPLRELISQIKRIQKRTKVSSTPRGGFNASMTAGHDET